METVIMARDDVGEIVVNATDVAEWEGHGFALKAAPSDDAPKKRGKPDPQE